MKKEKKGMTKTTKGILIGCAFLGIVGAVSSPNKPEEESPSSTPITTEVSANIEVPSDTEKSTVAERLLITEATTTTETLPVTQAETVTEAPPVTETETTTEAPPVTETETTTEAPPVTEAETIAEVPPVTETATTTEEASPDNHNNFNTYDNELQQQTEDTYVLNTSRMKIHHPSCRSVKQIAPQNYATSSSSLEDLISQGYSTCGICFK